MSIALYTALTISSIPLLLHRSPINQHQFRTVPTNLFWASSSFLCSSSVPCFETVSCSTKSQFKPTSLQGRPKQQDEELNCLSAHKLPSSCPRKSSKVRQSMGNVRILPPSVQRTDKGSCHLLLTWAIFHLLDSTDLILSPTCAEELLGCPEHEWILRMPRIHAHGAYSYPTNAPYLWL